jgi:ATP-dependent protease ClpP protease subunit
MGQHHQQHQYFKSPKGSLPILPDDKSLLDIMVDGREFESLLNYQIINRNIKEEIVKSILEVENIRKRPVICYMANTVNPNIKAITSINAEDDLPINELISSIDSRFKEIDVVIETTGGSAQQVDKIVNALRPRFDNVSFILPSSAMSAGSILIMSGDEIIMNSKSCFGPIDPQVVGKNGQFVPAQSIIELINEIQVRGQELLNKRQNPLWTDIQILNNIDPKEIGNALSGSDYSVGLVHRYLRDYKFKNWKNHSDGREVTDNDRETIALKIANDLCNHKYWKAHGHGITRDMAETILKLKITKAESVEGLDKAIRRMWALFYWIFESTKVYKLFVSSNYCIAKNDLTVI